MAYKSGVTGKLVLSGSNVLGVRNIQDTQSSNNPTFNTSETDGHKVSVGGTKSFTLSCDIVLDDGKRIETQMEVGDAVTIQVHEDDSSYMIYPARLESVAKTIDINDGGEITQAAAFTANGVWTFVSGSQSS